MTSISAAAAHLGQGCSLTTTRPEVVQVMHERAAYAVALLQASLVRSLKLLMNGALEVS